MKIKYDSALGYYDLVSDKSIFLTFIFKFVNFFYMKTNFNSEQVSSYREDVLLFFNVCA